MSILLRSGEFFGRAVAADVWGELSIAETRYAPRAFLPRHRHEAPYLTFVLAGGYREQLAAETRTCGARSLVLHPAGDTHEDHFAERPSRCLNVNVGAAFLGRLGGAADSLHRGGVVDDEAVASYGARIVAELRCADAAAPLIVEGLMLELFGVLARRTSAARGATRAWLTEARALVERNWNGTIVLSDLAQMVGVHPVHLARSYRTQYGMTVGEHVRALRITHARERIAAGDTLTTVAHDAGFADQSHFTRAFVRAVGITPAEYRRRLRVAR